MADDKPKTAIEVQDPTLLELPPPAEDVVVLARNHHEMVEAQQQLLAWAERKVEIEKAAVKEAEANLAQAKASKHRTQGWQTQVYATRRRRTYYEKIRDAIAAGYYIVPNFPFQVIGVRTKKAKPPRKSVRGFSVPNVKPEGLPTGEGRYVDSEPLVSTHTKQEWDDTLKRHRPVTFSRASDFDEFDFPYKVVKPKILSDLTAAMKQGIFDEIGVLPSRNRGRRGDPMVVGTIKRTEGYNVHQVTFLISWWIDTRDL